MPIFLHVNSRFKQSLCGSTAPKHTKCNKNVRKTTDVIRICIRWLKVIKCFSKKYHKVHIKMYPNCSKSIKTSELEDQYAVMFSLAPWPEEPYEVHSFQKEFVFTKVVVKISKKIRIRLKGVPVAPFALIFSQNRSQRIQEAF